MTARRSWRRSTSTRRSEPRRGFDGAVRQWLKEQHFRPESIAGLSVATRIRTPISFSVDPAVTSLDAVQKQARASLEHRLAEQALSPVCIAASAPTASGQGLALDSQIRVEPVLRPEG